MDLATQKTVLYQSLTNSQDLYNKYVQLAGNSGGAIQNSQLLASQKVDLKNQLVALTTEAETLNREFIDRSEAAPIKATFLKRIGFSTTQDWVLASFFGSYVLGWLVLFIYIIRYSTQITQGLLVATILAVILGAAISSLLLYFA